ncbi:MAG TPA: hypothetical protein VIK28_03720, partial [Sedimentisphaerales bacterium]
LRTHHTLTDGLVQNWGKAPVQWGQPEMLRRLKKIFRREQSEPVDVSRLIRPMLSNYARTHRGSFMLRDTYGDASNTAGNRYEIYCIFPKEASAAAADYAKRLMDGLGLQCQVLANTHKELLSYLSPQASFIYERRSGDRKIA